MCRKYESWEHVIIMLIKQKYVSTFIKIGAYLLSVLGTGSVTCVLRNS